MKITTCNLMQGNSKLLLYGGACDNASQQQYSGPERAHISESLTKPDLSIGNACFYMHTMKMATMYRQILE